MSHGSRLLLLGLRGSGKTSYLAALWHLLESGEIPAQLRAESLQPDRQYLNQIRDRWLAFEEVGRTSMRSSETVSLSLRDASTGVPVQITLPDLSGESFRLQWTMRKATRNYAEYVSDCAGVLVFVHPEDIKRSQLISPRARRGRKPGVDEMIRPWSSEDTPTQVQLVELVQFVSYLRKRDDPLRLAVIVSAWDLVEPSIPPSEWLDIRVPLVSQYMRANSTDIPSEIYGVSALGGDLERDRAKLVAERAPSKRIRVVDRRLSPHTDLSAPLRFLLAIGEGSSDRVAAND